MLAPMTDSPAPEPDAPVPDRSDAPEPKKRRGLFIGIAVAAVVIIAGAIAIPVSIANAEAAAAEAAEVAAAKAERDRLATFALALEECGTKPDVNVTILDDGESLSLQRVGKWTGPSIEGLYCVLNRLDAPSSLEAKIAATRALDGVQTDDWSGFEIEWRYHPDDGATVLIEHAS